MDTESLMSRLREAVDQQLQVAGGAPEVEAAARSLLAALEPAVRHIATEVLEHAATEMAAQIPGYEIDVVMAAGAPTLKARPLDSGDAPAVAESLDARITFRLPPTLKELIEVAADERGESVNSWLVKTVAAQTHTGQRGRSRRMTGTIET